jgi:hypothetical protein
MAHYTVHVAESDMAMGSASPLSAIEAYYKVRELRAMGLAPSASAPPARRVRIFISNLLRSRFKLIEGDMSAFIDRPYS